MDIFVPPGWMTRTELVDRVGKALFGDRWLEPMPTTAEILHASPERRDILLRNARAAVRRALRAGHQAESSERVLSQRLAELLEALRAEEPDKAEMHDRVVDKIREALSSAEFRSGLKTASGEIHVGPPLYFWQGDRALPAFDTGKATYGREVQTHVGRVLKDPVTGRVLFKRDEAEAWLATLQARPAEGGAPVAAADTPPAGSLPSIAEVLSAEKPVAQSPNAAAQNSPNNLEAGINEAVPKEIQPLEDETRPPGRPSNIRLVEDELDRRIACGDTLSSQRALAKSLSKWLRKEHPEKTPLAPNTIRNRLGHKMPKARPPLETKI